MFWRFGFNSGSGIDSLLDKEDVNLENILDEDDLLQECKTQNTRLIEYFGRVDVLSRLLVYAIEEDVVGDEKLMKYSHLATEVLCSDIWSVVETCVNEKQALLVPFWESIFERSTDDLEKNVIPAVHFAKINGNFLNKKPTELLQFVQTQNYAVERFVYHIECQPLLELLTRMIQTEGQFGTEGVVDWLSSEHFLDRLVDLLNPKNSPDTQLIAADLLKAIIAMTTPSPGDGMQQATVSNRFARELATRATFTKLTSFVMLDFALPSSPDVPSSYPNFESNISSATQSMGVITELIRKNNSDYFEPFLFHSLRNRMIQVQQDMHSEPDRCREAMEEAFQEMTHNMGVVDMAIVLQTMGDHLEKLVGYLKAPRYNQGPKPTSLGDVVPLTTERFRIIELIAELIHCSNMAILNRSSKHDHLYDSQGRLQGGLAALDELAYVISLPDGTSAEDTEDDADRRTPSLEFPVSRDHSQSSQSSFSSSDDGLSDEDEEAMEEIMMMSDSISSSPETHLHATPLTAPLSQLTGDATDGGTTRDSHRRSSSESISHMYPGDAMKEAILRCNVFSILMDLFSQFPWNNFLHSAVYDILHQVFTGPFDSSLNKQMAISILRDSNLMQRVLDMQALNDTESSKPNGLRLGYMGHLTLISEDIIASLLRFNDADKALVSPSIPAGWDEYIAGRYQETKQRDSISLGGGKPVLASAAGGAGRWKVDEAESNTLTLRGSDDKGGGGSGAGEFRRTGKLTRESSADFGPPMDDFDDDDFLQNSGSDDDEDSGSGGWLSRSSPFTLKPPPGREQSDRVSTRRPLPTGFDDSFGMNTEPEHWVKSPNSALDFSSPADDDGFGPFSASSTSSFGDEFDDSFGEDFGDFQAAGHSSSSLSSDDDDGQMTPTAGGSWTFAADEEDELASKLSTVMGTTVGELKDKSTTQ